jgi:hypothetical protein
MKLEDYLRGIGTENRERGREQGGDAEMSQSPMELQVVVQLVTPKSVDPEFFCLLTLVPGDLQGSRAETSCQRVKWGYLRTDEVTLKAMVGSIT